MRCPACGSKDVTSKKFGQAGGSWIEWYCRTCELFEDKSNRDADYPEWAARWSGAGKTAGRSTSKAKQPKPQVPWPRDPMPRREPVTPPPLDPREGTASDGRLLAEIFNEIVARPAEDSARLAYADAIAERRPGRAAILRHQIEWFRANQETFPARRRDGGHVAGITPELDARRAKACAIENGIDDRWGHYMDPHARKAHQHAGWKLERGFVGHLRTDPAVLLDPKLQIFKMAPIEHLTLTGVGDVRAALALPEIAQLRYLDLSYLGLVDADMELLAREGVLACCEILVLCHNKIHDAGVATLLASPRIRSMRKVHFGGNLGDPTMRYSHDMGYISDMFLPRSGEEAEQRYGRIEWLHPFDDEGEV